MIGEDDCIALFFVKIKDKTRLSRIAAAFYENLQDLPAFFCMGIRRRHAVSLIQLDHITFSYPGGLAPVFDDLSLQLDTDWKMGIIGRNGIGKSTFFALLSGEVRGEGRLTCDQDFIRFPIAISDENACGYELSCEFVPEREFWKVLREADLLGLSAEVFYRPVSTLSGGERTKLQLSIVFAADGFVLLDEPTDHLDRAGREALARYLSRKRGFFLVSHDRAVLDGCCDHILSFEKSAVRVTHGNYTVWRSERDKQEQADRSRKDQLEKERVRLREAANRIADWSDRAEGEKFGTLSSGLRADRGYLGAKAARVMKRATAARDRTARAESEISGLLKNFEENEPLRLSPEKFFRESLLSVRGFSVCIGEEIILRDLSFSMRQGERVALAGINGAGKSTFLKALAGEIPAEGEIDLSPRLKISYVPQTFLYDGTLADYAAEYSIDESYYKAILAKFGFARNDFPRRLSEMSEGQKKKAALARSLCERAHLYLWDEPLNYLDILSREQVENAILDSGESLLFVEHDAAFSEKIATRTVLIGNGSEKS